MMLVNDAKLLEVLRRDLEGCCGVLCLGAVAPQDGGGTFRRNHGIDRVFQHQDLVRRRDRNRTTGSAFTDNDGNGRALPRPEARIRRPGDCFRLATLFGAAPRICTGRVHES